jgi:hypothetical protein
LLIQTTTRDVFQRSATTETKSSNQKNTAMNALIACKDISQIHQELNATESSQLAVALNNMTQVVMSVFHAHHTKLLPTETKDASQDNAQVSTKFLAQLINAMLVKNARRDPPQITSREDV